MFALDNDTWIYFDKGAFDKYCVYINGDFNGRRRYRYAPTDDEYFEWIYLLAKAYGKKQVWDDFNSVYNIANNSVDVNNAKKLVFNIDTHYTEDTIIWWLIFYMTMIAENNKKYAILKKRIKKLGVYNVLFDEWDVNYIITYMKDTNWRILDKLMKERGI